MKNNQLLQYLSELPNWGFTEKDDEYMQECINLKKEPQTIKGFIELKEGWYCEFSKQKIAKEILDEFKQGERFEKIYSAKVKMTKGLTDSRNASYPHQKIFQQNLEEHLRRSALREIAEKHSLKYGTQCNYETTYWGDAEYGKTRYTHLILTKLIVSPGQLDSIFQATKEWEELLNNKKYQNLCGNIQKKIKKDLNKIVG